MNIWQRMLRRVASLVLVTLGVTVITFALLMGIIFTATNSIVDMAYLWLDPRIHP